jgi:hypothetical protein
VSFRRPRSSAGKDAHRQRHAERDLNRIRPTIVRDRQLVRQHPRWGHRIRHGTDGETEHGRLHLRHDPGAGRVSTGMVPQIG